MQDAILQFATVSMLLVVGILGIAYVVRNDIGLENSIFEVKREDILFWLDHQATLDLNRFVIENLRDREDVEIYISPIAPPQKRWQRRGDFKLDRNVDRYET